MELQPAQLKLCGTLAFVGENAKKMDKHRKDTMNEPDTHTWKPSSCPGPTGHRRMIGMLQYPTLYWNQHIRSPLSWVEDMLFSEKEIELSSLVPKCTANPLSAFHKDD